MKRLPFIVFAAVALVFLSLGNIAISQMVIASFGIVEEWLIWSIELIPIILTLGFVVALIIGSKYYNPLTRILYVLSSMWMGFFVYLIGAVIVLALVSFVLYVTSTDATLHYLGIVLLFVAVITGIYGIVHARKIKIKHVDVVLKGLPQSWKGRKVVFISDIHLGQIHNQSFTERIVGEIEILNPDIVLIGGDLYDGYEINLKESIAPFEKLKPKLGTYFITGNHEEFRERNSFINEVKAVGIEVLDERRVDIDGVQLVGVSHLRTAEKVQYESVLAALGVDPVRPSILLKHEPRDIDVTAAAGISLQLSGHTHRAQVWPLGYVARRIYKGFDYGLKSAGRTQVYTSSGVGTWGPPMRVGTDSEIVCITFIALKTTD
ncbi:MAG: metallophosphoesterase [Patescibacteria group bacterium]